MRSVRLLANVAFVVLAVTVGAVLMGVLASANRAYFAEAVVKVLPDPALPDEASASFSPDANRFMQTEVRSLLENSQFAEFDGRIEQIGTTDLMRIVGRGESAAGAAEVSNQVVEAYVDTRQEQYLQRIDDRLEVVAGQIGQLESRMGSPDTAEAAADPALSFGVGELQRLTALEHRLEMATLLSTSSATVVSMATPEAARLSDPPARSAAVGALLGALVGLSFVLLGWQLRQRAA